MLALIAALLGIALLDSLNPSALTMTLVLLAAPRPARSVLTYLAGVFGTYFACGLLLMLGLGRALAALGDLGEHPAVYAVQGAIGAGLLAYSFFMPTTSKAPNTTLAPRSVNGGALFLLGVTITGVELTTALPYLGAIGLLTNAGLTPAGWLPLLVGYNLIFIAPPLLLLAAYLALGARAQPHLARLREKLTGGMGQAWPWIVGIIGFFLLADALRYFLRFAPIG